MDGGDGRFTGGGADHSVFGAAAGGWLKLTGPAGGLHAAGSAVTDSAAATRHAPPRAGRRSLMHLTAGLNMHLTAVLNRTGRRIMTHAPRRAPRAWRRRT